MIYNEQCQNVQSSELTAASQTHLKGLLKVDFAFCAKPTGPQVGCWWWKQHQQLEEVVWSPRKITSGYKSWKVAWYLQNQKPRNPAWCLQTKVGHKPDSSLWWPWRSFLPWGLQKPDRADWSKVNAWYNAESIAHYHQIKNMGRGWCELPQQVTHSSWAGHAWSRRLVQIH